MCIVPGYIFQNKEIKNILERESIKRTNTDIPPFLPIFSGGHTALVCCSGGGGGVTL